MHIDAGAPTTPIRSGKELTVKGGDWTDWTVCGGYATTATNVEGYSLTLDGVTGIFRELNDGAIYGGYANSDGKNADGNTLTLKNSTVTRTVYGGQAWTNGNGDGNTVILDHSTVTGSVYGGEGCNKKTAINNTVWLKDSKVNGNVGVGHYGSQEKTYDEVTGNTLKLSGANTVTGTIIDVATAELHDAVWDTTKPMLTVRGYDDVGTFYNNVNSNPDSITTSIDASKLQFANAEAISAGGTMDLIKSTYYMNGH